MPRKHRLFVIFLFALVIVPTLSAGSADKRHWAFQPVVRPSLPRAHEAYRVRSDIDRFIMAALEHKGLTLASEADRATLARRLCFDLTGLPPTPEEVTAFVNDQ